MSNSKTPAASAHRKSMRPASLPGLAPDCCLLANIQLPGNVESALLLFHLIFFTPCTGFFSSAAPAALAFPRIAESTAVQSVLPAKSLLPAWPQLPCPELSFPEPSKPTRQSSGSSSSGEWQQHSLRWWQGINSGVKPGFTFCWQYYYRMQAVYFWISVYSIVKQR